MRLLNRLRSSKAGHHEQGSVLLETVLVLLLLAMFEVGRAVYIQTALNAATHQGARVASQRGGGSIGNNAARKAFENAVKEDPLLDPEDIVSAKYTPGTCTNRNSTITGETRYRLRFVFPGFNAIARMAGGGAATTNTYLTGKANLRCEVTW